MSSSAYDKTIVVKGRTIQIIMDGSIFRIYYDGRQVAESERKNQGTCTLVFTVEENNKAVTYDIGILATTFVRSFVGRDGDLIYSDDPHLHVDKTNLI